MPHRFFKKFLQTELKYVRCDNLKHCSLYTIIPQEPLCDAVEFARPADGTAVRARDMRAVVGKLLMRLVGMAVDVGSGRRGLSFGALSERRESREA